MKILNQYKKQWKLFSMNRDVATTESIKYKIKTCSFLGVYALFLSMGLFSLTFLQYVLIGYIGFTVLGCTYSLINFILGISFIMDRDRLREFLYIKKLNGDK